MDLIWNFIRLDEFHLFNVWDGGILVTSGDYNWRTHRMKFKFDPSIWTFCRMEKTLEPVWYCYTCGKVACNAERGFLNFQIKFSS